MKFGAVSRHLVGDMGWSLRMIAKSVSVSLLEAWRGCWGEARAVPSTQQPLNCCD